MLILPEANIGGEEGPLQGPERGRRLFVPELKNLDPFLMLDELLGDPSFMTLILLFGVGKLMRFLILFCSSAVSHLAGFPDQPRRGLEMVTVHWHKGTIGAGDLQWMTTGRGIIHSEMPDDDTGMQLWINLSSKDKMSNSTPKNESVIHLTNKIHHRIQPCHQELLRKDISRFEKDCVDLRIIAGEVFDVRTSSTARTCSGGPTRHPCPLTIRWRLAMATVSASGTSPSGH